MKIPLAESASAVADGAGNAIVRMSPQVAGSSWVIKRIVTAIPTMDPLDVANLAIYKNTITEAFRLDATSSAAQDTSETDIPVATTDVIIGVYSNVATGASCTLTVTGDKETGRI